MSADPPLPLEPLFTLKVAAEIIPFPSVEALRQWLYRHRDEFPARYRRTSKGTTHIRLLTATECRTIQTQTLVKKIPNQPKHNDR